MILSVLKNSNCRVVLLILLIKLKKGKKKSYQVIFLITSFLIHLTRFVCLGDRFIKFSLIRDGKKNDFELLYGRRSFLNSILIAFYAS